MDLINGNINININTNSYLPAVTYTSSSSLSSIMSSPTTTTSSTPTIVHSSFPSSSSYPQPISLAGFFLPFVSDDETLRRWSSFIGIVIAICGNILISLALNIQKYAHIRLERASDERRRLWKRRRRNQQRAHSSSSDSGTDSPDSISSYPDGSSSVPGTPPPDEETGLLLPPPREKDSPPPPDQQYLSSPYWWVGFVLMTVGECGNFLAYGFAPASIVSPLGVVALISNCVIAPVILKEPLRRRDVIGVVVSILGAVVVVWSAEKEETKLGPDQILEAISQTAFEVYFGITCAMIVALMYLSSKYGRKTILIDLGLVALFGGYTVLSTKGISSLLSSSFYHIFTYPIAYLFTTILLLTAVLQIKYVNRALQRFDSTQVIPTQFVLFTISVILGSAILYRDFETVTPERMLKFITGCALTFWGVWLISSRRNGKQWDDPDDPDDLDDLAAAGSSYGGTAPTANININLNRDPTLLKSAPASSAPPPPRGQQRPQIVRGISASSIAILDSFSGTPTPGQSRMGSYISSRPPSRLAEESPIGSVARRGGLHRKSVSNLLPGPLLMGDFASPARTRSRRNSEVDGYVGAGGEPGGREIGVGRRRSGSLGVVLDLLASGARVGEESGEE